jgi:cell division protein FtsQ
VSATATAARPAGPAEPPNDGEKRRKPRRRRLLVGLLVGTLVLLLGTGGWLVFFSSELAVRQVRVSGITDLTVEQVQAAAQVPIGRPLARQDLTAIGRRTTQLPKVAEARVRRDWPDAISISVVERQPVLAVAQPGGFVIIDKTGVAYASSVTVPTGVQQVDVNPDNGPLLAEVGVVSTALPASLRKKVDRIAALSADDIVVRLDSGIVVTWGGSSDSVLKAQITEALLKRKPKSTIDVSSPHTPAFR